MCFVDLSNICWLIEGLFSVVSQILDIIWRRHLRVMACDEVPFFILFVFKVACEKVAGLLAVYILAVSISVSWKINMLFGLGILLQYSDLDLHTD